MKGSGAVGKRIYTTSPMPPAQGKLHKYYNTVWLSLASGLWTKQKG